MFTCCAHFTFTQTAIHPAVSGQSQAWKGDLRNKEQTQTNVALSTFRNTYSLSALSGSPYSHLHILIHSNLGLPLAWLPTTPIRRTLLIHSLHVSGPLYSPTLSQYQFLYAPLHFQLGPFVSFKPNFSNTSYEAHDYSKHFKMYSEMYKGKVFYGQEPPSRESTTTECGFNYQLLAVIY